MSKQQSGPALIHVPERFSVVESGVYRCASPNATQVSGLGMLRCWIGTGEGTIDMCLSIETTVDSVRAPTWGHLL